MLNTHEWAKVREEDGTNLEVQQVKQVKQTQQVQHQHSHNNSKDNKIANDAHIVTMFNWLEDLWRPYCLHEETFHLAREFMNNFLRVAPLVPTDRLQLVGITCLYLSCGVLERSTPNIQGYKPSIEGLAEFTNGAVKPEEIRQLIITSRGFDGGPIPPEDFKDLGWGPESGKTHIPQQELEPVREPEQRS